MGKLTVSTIIMRDERRSTDAALSLCATTGSLPSTPSNPNASAPTVSPTPLVPKSPVCQREGQASIPASSARGKRVQKTENFKRDRSVPFDEMRRIMRVYGPIKTLRNRGSKDANGSAKPESIRRKL